MGSFDNQRDAYLNPPAPTGGFALYGGKPEAQVTDPGWDGDLLEAFCGKRAPGASRGQGSASAGSPHPAYLPLRQVRTGYPIGPRRFAPQQGQACSGYPIEGEQVPDQEATDTRSGTGRYPQGTGRAAPIRRPQTQAAPAIDHQPRGSTTSPPDAGEQSPTLQAQQPGQGGGFDAIGG